MDFLLTSGRCWSKEVSGDFDVAIVVESIEQTNEWAKAGIMARQTLEPGSINVLAAARAANDLVTFQRRDVTDGGSASERFTPDESSFPAGVRLIKDGDVFSGDWGEGTDWSGDPITKDGVTPTPPLDLVLAEPYYLGLAVTSHAEGPLRPQLSRSSTTRRRPSIRQASLRRPGSHPRPALARPPQPNTRDRHARRRLPRGLRAGARQFPTPRPVMSACPDPGAHPQTHGHLAMRRGHRTHA